MRAHPEVLIIGAGPAGIAAALRLARAGVRVMVVEGAEYAGAENWSGCVYHADGLLRDDVLGAALWDEAPRERRIVARSLFLHDGLAAAGFEARAHADNDYGEAWTVLRPKLDRWLAARAIDFGATVLTGTTVTGLRYQGKRVSGVDSERGPIEADVVFIAEGDAAGLLAREGLERQPRPHYAQGIKAVFALDPAEIERRFMLAPGEGVAQEWLLRNGRLAGRTAALNLTAFLYTNRDSLSVGLVLPLTHLATHAVADHPHLLKRVLATAGLTALLKDARQVAYGAKVIRSGGVDETPEWVRDGLAIGGGGLGLGLEIPYPNFIAPAITSALTFADAVVRLRERGLDYERAHLEQEYAAPLRGSDDYANAHLIRRWPAALHGGGLMFDHLPALFGQLVDAAGQPGPRARGQQRRALAMQLAHLRTDVGQALRLARGMGPPLAARAPKVPPLQVRFLVAHGDTAPVEAAWQGDALLRIAAEAIGHFYGRRLPSFAARLDRVWRGLLRLPLAAPRLAGLGGGALLGGFHLLGDLIAYKLRKLPLRELLQRPYHQHEDMSQRALDWAPARRSPASAVAWIAPMTRYQPDRRHLTVPLAIGEDGARQLTRVCPAEVYSLAGHLGGVASQHENCIKCESCRVTVPGVDWNRLSRHRLAYRVPDDGRRGFDCAVASNLALTAPTAISLAPVEARAWQDLYLSLSARPAMVGAEWPQVWRQMLADIAPGDATRRLRARLGGWLDQGGYGWIESELRAFLVQAGALPPTTRAVTDPQAHARARRAHGWAGLRSAFSPERLRLLATATWRDSDQRFLLRWIDAVRAQRIEAVEWLAGWSPALAWIACSHYVAEENLGQPLHDELAAPLWREHDGYSNWLPGMVACLIDTRGQRVARAEVVAHGAGTDAAQPVRLRVESGLAGFSATRELAELMLALAIGQAQALHARALEYASQRVQFRGDLKDSEGRDAIAKFGAIKQMLAANEQALAAMRLARTRCEREPHKVLALVRAHMGPWMDGVPWMAGQIFGGMAYSEEDILAPRYRDAILFSQWPGARELTTEDPDFEPALLAEAVADAGADAAPARHLRDLGAVRQRLAALSPPHAAATRRFPARGTRALTWQLGAIRYQSGSFINGHLLAPTEMLTPEHYRRDPRLRAARAAVLRLLRSGFRSPDRRQLYGRYIDEQHGMPDADVNRLREFNAFATIVPESLGGKGWNKAQYSVLSTLTMGSKDTSVGLLIMASTSIGTMPVMLGLEKDLPKVEHELDACLGDNDAWRALRRMLDGLIDMLERPDPKRLRTALEAWGKHIQRMFLFPGSTLKYLARAYLLRVQRTVDTAKRRDLDGLRTQLLACRDALAALRADLEDERADIAARRAAHERFLRFLACGQISAFALTEPSAGSDTGGIQTRAQLREVPVEADGRGFYRFTPASGGEPRVLLDGARLAFRNRQAFFRLPDDRLARLDDSEWDLRTQSGRRAVRIDDSVYPYDDIGTVALRNGRLVYRYWELTGNKMWITNGSVADRYSLYTQTEFGETGLMVERRSEGLRIGPNENKLGQRASPTNELTFERVRVSADQVIGFKGHGQVNALETLSVGRGGLVMGCATLADRLLNDYRAEWRRDPHLHGLACAELDRIETLAARLMGLMDRVDLNHGDFRIEAALSKYLASEGLHRILMWFEKIHGPMSAAREHMIEKWRRDIRILNIYEGTNEVQRFLALKDLPALMQEAAPRQVDNAPLDSALQAFRDFVGPRARELGARLWQDPDLQLRWFPVVDWAAELYCWCALHERARLLEWQGDPVDADNLTRLRAHEASQALHVQARAERVRADFALAEGGAGHPADAALAVARTLLNRAPAEDDRPASVGALDGDWVAVLRSRVELTADGAAWSGWHAPDVAVLDRLLDWADAGGMRVKLAVLAPRGVEDRLRRLQAAGAELLHVVQPAGEPDAAAAARAIRAHWPEVTRWAIGRAASSPLDHGFAQMLACLLDAELPDDVAAVAPARRGQWMENTEFRRRYLSARRRVAFAWDLKPSGRSDRFGVDAWLAALRVALPVVETAPARVGRARPAPVRTEAGLPERFADARELAAWLKARFGARARAEPAARLAPAEAPLSAPVIWLAPAADLTAVQSSAARRLRHGLGASESAVLAWHATGAPWPAPSRLVDAAGLRGIWQLPLGYDPAPADLASVIAARLDAPVRLVLDAGQRLLAAALAARLGWPLFDQVVEADDSRVSCAYEGYVLDHELPAAAVLVASPGYPDAVLVEPPPRALPATRLAEATARIAALERWQRRWQSPRAGLATAPLVVDVGRGVSDESLYKELVPPLRAALAAASGQNVEIGATRKITQELKLLPVEHQIGQTGIAIAPDLILALGISGAPQHMSWIDPRAVVIAINNDPQAPIFSWHRENPGPRVIACVGDLREWVPAVVDLLAADGGAQSMPRAASDPG